MPPSTSSLHRASTRERLASVLAFAFAIAFGTVLFWAAGAFANPSSLDSAPDVSGSRSADPRVAANWLAQKVCVDRIGRVLRVDPYAPGTFGDECPARSSIRNLRETDPVPYYKYLVPVGDRTNRARYRYTNAFESTTGDGERLYVMDRQFEPTDAPADWYVDQTFYPGSTHWDVYRIVDGWVSNVATRDNTGLNQIFFGNSSARVTPYGGWIDFPDRAFATTEARTAAVPIDGAYWELSGSAWPVPSPTLPEKHPTTDTTWKLVRDYTFDSGKTMATLVSYHQSRPQPSDPRPDDGHMEAWYFTVPYGPTRWEVWSAASCLQRACKSYIKNNCRGGAQTMTMTYRGASYRYYRTDCSDWEAGTALAVVGSTVPTLPVPQSNVIANFHFAADPPGTARRATAWRVGDALRLTQLQSHAAGDDDQGRFPGVRYARIACAGTCRTTSTLAQDVALHGDATYSFGIEARTESAAGVIAVSLEQIDADGRIVARGASVNHMVDARGDGSNCRTRPGVENCAVYVGERTRVHVVTGATRLRVSIAPLTPNVDYDVTDVYLSRT